MVVKFAALIPLNLLSPYQEKVTPPPQTGLSPLAKSHKTGAYRLDHKVGGRPQPQTNLVACTREDDAHHSKGSCHWHKIPALLDNGVDRMSGSKIGVANHEIHQANQVPPDFHWVDHTSWAGFPEVTKVGQFEEWGI